MHASFVGCDADPSPADLKKKNFFYVKIDDRDQAKSLIANHEMPIDQGVNIMNRLKIDAVLKGASGSNPVVIRGWVRTKRDAKTFSFIEVNDGSCLANLQVIGNDSLANYEDIKKLTTGSAIKARGRITASQGKGQQWELIADEITILSLAPLSFPLQKKRHSDEFLRSIAHLRARTNKYGAAFRIRSKLAFAIHHFFHERGFHYINTPILTASDCEGAGEMFRVTTQGQNPTSGQADFFGKPAHLTVSGQLEAEMMALALGDVYTFGPTFRAENSNTRRHASEFWMIEPEMAFTGLTGTMDLAEEMIQFLVDYTLTHCAADIDLFARFVDKTLGPFLQSLVKRPFERIAHGEAIEILKNSSKKFEFPIKDNMDLQAEHERFLTENHFKKPVIVYNFPKEIKPFYMRLNDDNQTVAAMDLLVPGIGEIIGGSQREERYNRLLERMTEIGLPKEEYWWYLESRQYGSVIHSGFGMGFERLLMMVTGIRNIRDVIPFPRTPNNIEF